MTLKAVQIPKGRGALLKMADADAQSSNSEPSEEQRIAAREWFNPIFQKICGHCPGWKQAIGEGAIGVTAGIWFETLTSRREILSQEVLNRGMRNLQAKRLTWLPSPLDFVDMCLESEALPSLAEAKYEIMLGRKTEYVDGKWVKMPFSSPFVEYLASKTGLILHPTTSAEQRDVGFSIEYRAAVEKAKSGYFDKTETKQLPQKPMDSNLAYYFLLLKSHGEGFAKDFLSDCAKRGIHIDPENETVTRNVNVTANRAN